MTEQPSPVSRRTFLVSSAAAAVASTAHGATRYEKIYAPADSPLPLRTAAAELAAATGATIVDRQHQGAIRPGEIVLALGDRVRAYPGPAAMLPASAPPREWEIVKSDGGGLVIAGSTPRNACRAALGWIENPARETDRLSVYRFDERFSMWDNPLNQMYRLSKQFDRRRHIREYARLGHTGIEVNRFASTGGYFVRHRKFPADSYTWYLSYAPALDAFVESSLTEGLYPREELAANLADLRDAAQIARSFGMAPGFVCYEPRCVPEAIFDRYPHLRGSRTDHPGRSLEPRYALDIANPRVLEHYAELLTNLMKEVPDLRYFVFFTEDSGSGIPFSKSLYAGPNGSWLARSKTVERMTADFTGTLAEAGRKINPDFEVIMQMNWEYGTDERTRITAALPKGVTLCHEMGGEMFGRGELGSHVQFVRDDRAMGKEPYADMVVSGRWEQAPLVGVAAPRALANKMEGVQQLKLRRIFTAGGIFAPPQCRYNINQELYAELIRGPVPDLDRFLLDTATRWCDGDARAAAVLAEAWKIGDAALAAWPLLNWYHAGPGQTQGRWLTRPVVPDITRLSQRERAAFERALFTLPWDIGRQNISFEGGIRMYHEDSFDTAIRAYDTGMLPQLEKTVAILEGALGTSPKPVLVDQRDRYRGLLLSTRTVRNLFDAQAAINIYLLKKGDQAAVRRRLNAAIAAEIDNTRAWLGALRESKTYFFRVAEEETPFLYKTPLEDMELKLAAMQAHANDEPGPQLKELALPFSARKLLFYE